MDKDVYMIHERGADNTPETAVEVYGMSAHNTTEFESASDARRSNYHDVYEDREKYKINKYRVTYTLIEDDV